MEIDVFKIRKDLENKVIKTNYELSGGMMNKSFVFSYLDKDYVWYVPTEQANQMVNRKLEEEAQNICFKLGITSKNLIFFNDGMKINEFIHGNSLNHVKEYDYRKVSKLLHKLHDSNSKVSEDYNPFIKVYGYEKEALSLGIKLEDKYYELLNAVNEQKEFLESQKKVLCHNDFQKSNIIQSDDGSYYVIDFEFAMNNDPFFDIGAFGNNDVNEGFELLKIYTNNDLSLNNLKRFLFWRMLLSLQWYLVALIKDKHGEGEAHGFDFVQVAHFFLNNADIAHKMYLEKTGDK